MKQGNQKQENTKEAGPPESSKPMGIIRTILVILFTVGLVALFIVMYLNSR